MRLVIAIAAVATVLVASGCASSAEKPTLPRSAFGGGPATGLIATQQRSLRCPPHAPQAMSLEVAGPPMVRPRAVLLELCRYPGANALRPLHLSRSRLFRSVSLINRLTRELNRLPQASGVYHCPMGDGSEMVLHFGYRHLRPRQVIVSLTGCSFVTNGRTDRRGPSPEMARLVKQLIALANR